jgi:hypothetical protein
VTSVPTEKFARQVPGQLIPAGVLVIFPAPVAGAVTVSGYVVGDEDDGFGCNPTHPLSASADSRLQQSNRAPPRLFIPLPFSCNRKIGPDWMPVVLLAVVCELTSRQ